MKRFVYADKEKALSDLAKFSGMNSVDGQPRYVCLYGGGWIITDDCLINEVPEAVGINGTVFIPR